MFRYLILAVSILLAGYTQSAVSQTYFCSNTEKPPTLRAITVSGEYAIVETGEQQQSYNVLDNRLEVLVMGRLVGFGETESEREGYSVLVLDKRKMVMQAANAWTNKAYVEPKSTCMAQN